MAEKKIGVSPEFTLKEQEIDLVDILGFIRGHRVILVASLILGLIGGITIYSYLPNKWQADITLQIGKIPVRQNFVFIDPPAQVIAKINSPFFLSKMLPLMYGKNITSDSPTAAMLYKDLKASLVRGSDLVNVHVFGWTADEAYRNASIVADSIVAQHRAMAAPYLGGMQKQLSEIIDDIARNREVLMKVNAIDESAPAKNEANALLKVALIDAKSTEIQKLKKEQAQLEETLSVAQLQTTSIVGRSLVPRTPASPKLGLWIIGGGFIGLLLGLLLSFSVSVRRRGSRGS
jgi:hypothetical protein